MIIQNKDLFICPARSGNFITEENILKCRVCSNNFAIDNGIPLLFWQDDKTNDSAKITAAVKSFYEETPFPGYDESDSAVSLWEKANRSGFAKLLDDQIPHNARILDVGCGTGQLSSFPV